MDKNLLDDAMSSHQVDDRSSTSAQREQDVQQGKGSGSPNGTRTNGADAFPSSDGGPPSPGGTVDEHLLDTPVAVQAPSFSTMTFHRHLSEDESLPTTRQTVRYMKLLV